MAGQNSIEASGTLLMIQVSVNRNSVIQSEHR